ncbi:MAG: phage portal protein [Acidobacteriota bacterium]
MFERFRAMWQSGERVGPANTAIPRVYARSGYESASTAPRVRDWNPPDLSAAGATTSASTIRTRCRDAVRNDSWARAIVETFDDDLIGWGIKPLSRALNEIFRQATQALWEDWSAVADADGVLDMAGLQSLIVRTWAVDGECFIRLRYRKPEDGLPVPLQVQILPAEICPIEHTTIGTDGATIQQGIEYDAIGRRIAYWCYDTPPGDELGVSGLGTLHRVPAAQMLHLFDPLRPGQRRGVSMLAPALVRLRELDKYADATLLRLELSSMFVATLKRPPELGQDDLNPLTGRPFETTPDGRAVLQMSPGAFQELYPDEDLTFNDPPDPPVGFDAYVQHELRAAGAAVGVPLECFTHAWGATNDRLARVVLNQYRRRLHRLLWSVVVPQVLRPLWNAWFKLAIGIQALPINPDMYLEDRLGRVTFVPHAHAYVHPVQDVASYREAVRSGLTSRAAAVAEQGEDAELIDAQNAADNARADKLGLKYDSDGRVNQKGTK